MLLLGAGRLEVQASGRLFLYKTPRIEFDHRTHNKNKVSITTYERYNMEELSKEWFELHDHRRRLFSRNVWIPIYGVVHPLPLARGKFADIGYVEETLAVQSAVSSYDKREQAEALGWSDWYSDSTAPWIDNDDRYVEAGSFEDHFGEQLGKRLVLWYSLNSNHPTQVIIDQDFVLAYGLIEEGNYWLRPNEGYEQVIRLTRHDDGTVIFAEIRAEYLKDYLAARNAALRLYYYRQRRAILKNDPRFDWPENSSLVSEPNDRVDVYYTEINESGHSPGDNFAVFKTWRTDVDPEEEVPDFAGQDDDVTASESFTGTFGDQRDRFLITGEMWRGEWIEPANKSCRIGYDEPDEPLLVQTDGGGEKVDIQTLRDETVGKYLWFKPEVVNDLLSRRGSVISWYTRETGGISPSPDWLLNFGVNNLGLINTYAYDVAVRPLWERRIWVAHNCRPDGGVSEELMNAQMACQPADTVAPEFLIHEALTWLTESFRRNLD